MFVSVHDRDCVCTYFAGLPKAISSSCGVGGGDKRGGRREGRRREPGGKEEEDKERGGDKGRGKKDEGRIQWTSVQLNSQKRSRVQQSLV